MILSFKDIRFTIEALELLIKTYQDRLHIAEGINEDEAAELGNDIKYLELFLASIKESLNSSTIPKQN
jgi:hypothetical protein